MPTIREVLSKAHMSEDLPESIKYRWLGELDKKKYNHPEDADTELKLRSVEVYTLYLDAMDAFFSGDLMEYSVKAELFHRAYDEESRNERRCFRCREKQDQV